MTYELPLAEGEARGAARVWGFPRVGGEARKRASRVLFVCYKNTCWNFRITLDGVNDSTMAA